MDAEELLGGMALPHGVALLSRRRLALGYHDEKGALRLYTREIKGSTGGLLSLWILISESLRALWKTYPDQSGARYVLAGALLGTPIGLFLRWAMPLPSWQMGLLGSALLALMGLGLYRFYPPFRQGLGRMARYHGAEHKTIWALEQGQVSREGVRRQPLLHLPWWLQPLALLPVLLLFRWMNRNPEGPLSRRLLALGYRFQRHTLAEPGGQGALWLAGKRVTRSAPRMRLSCP